MHFALKIVMYINRNPHDMARLRRMSGVCMQQDLHFEKLTVQEHLEFYGKIRVQFKKKSCVVDKCYT